MNPLQHADEQHEEFLKNGFMTLSTLTDETELKWLCGIYDRLFENYLSVDRGDYYDIAGTGAEKPTLPQIIKPEKYAPELLGSAHFARCKSIAAQFLEVPEDHLDFYGHAILKPPGYGAPTPWHQDEAYMSPRWRRQGLSIWTALDPATVESGCLHFIPGLHRGPVLPHHHIDHDDRIRGLTTDAVDPSAAVACPIAPGQATVHGLRTPHYAGPNMTGEPRRAYVLVFLGPATEAEVPEDRSWRTED